MFGNKKGKQKKASPQNRKNSMNRKANIKQQKRGVYPGHQCFNADDDRTYYSRKKVNGHSEGNKWIKNVLKKYNYTIKVVGKPFVQNRPPVGGVPE